ncbi:MAG: DUF58 domain-containing protein [Clostridiaceae bacterium]
MKIDYRYLLGVGLALAMNYLFGGYTGSAFLWITILLLAVAGLEMGLFSQALVVDVLVPQGRIQVNEPVRIALNLENKGILTIPYVTCDAPKLEDRRVISILAKDKEHLAYDFTPKVRGVIDVGVIRLGITDVLNILTRQRLIEPGQVKVYPNVRDVLTEVVDLSTIGEGSFFKTYSRENPYIVREMRRYSPGDSIRKINWKVSAKYSELYVKRGDTTEEKDVLIILDMNEQLLGMDAAGIYENSLVTDALSMSKGLVNQGIRHGFLMNDRRQQYFDIGSADAFDHLEEDLLYNKANSRFSMREFMAQKDEFLRERGTLLFFMRPIETDITACEHLKSDQNDVVVFAPHLSRNGISAQGRRLTLQELGGRGYEVV